MFTRTCKICNVAFTATDKRLKCNHCRKGLSKCEYKYKTKELNELSFKNYIQIKNKLIRKKEAAKQVKSNAALRHRINLNDYYVRSLLVKKRKRGKVDFTITPELIELKKKTITLQRWVKENNCDISQTCQ